MDCLEVIIKYPHIDRLDFEDYLNCNPDLKDAFDGDIERAKRHWQERGRFEGRSWKINNVDYEKVKKYIKDNVKCDNISARFNMITSLYNERNAERLQEYILTLKMNISNSLINRIYVFYDYSNGWNSEIMKLLCHENVSVIEYNGRPSFRDIFEFSNIIGQGKWIVCNGDIVPSLDFQRLPVEWPKKNGNNSLLSITRWEFISEDEMSIFNLGGKIPNILSQDTWVYESPLNYPSELNQVKIGEMLCDSNLNYLFKLHNLPIYNPCLDLRTFHIHFQNARSYKSGDMSNKLFKHSWTGYEDFFELIRQDKTAPCVEACRLEDIK